MSEENKKSWFERLQKRWGVSAGRAVIILVVFACTGFTVLFLKEPLLGLIVGDDNKEIWHQVVYFIVIFPVYLLLLLMYGFLFGQYQFFKAFAARSVSRFSRKKRTEEA